MSPSDRMPVDIWYSSGWKRRWLVRSMTVGFLMTPVCGLALWALTISPQTPANLLPQALSSFLPLGSRDGSISVNECGPIFRGLVALTIVSLAPRWIDLGATNLGFL